MEEKTSFSDLLEESINVPHEGKILKGKVVRVDEDDVFIDFGYKSEGIASLNEFYGKNGEPEVRIGDEVEVMLENWADNGELPKLSKKRADLLKEHERIEKIYKNSELISATVKEIVKGGLITDIGQNIEIKAFLPASQIDIRPQGDLSKLIGNRLESKIIKLTDNGIVLSRRIHLEEQREIQKNSLLSSLREGSTISGKVVTIIDRGVFIDLGGVEGFIPIGELSWGRVKHPSDILKLDEQVNVQVLKFDQGSRITLGLKQTKQDPWTFVDKKYKPGSIARSKVVSIVDFGIFIELEPGVEGLVHISEISWIKNFRHPKEVVNVGRRVEVMILEADVGKKRIALSLRQIEPSPWQIFRENNPPGTRVRGKVRNVNEKGIFVEVGEELIGLVRPSQISWKGKVNPQDSVKVDDDIEVVVLDVDEKNQRIALGIKQLNDDPWEEARRKYKPGETVLNGKVIHIKEKGVVVEVENELEGFIRISELTQQDTRDINKIVKIGDEISALVTGFEMRKRQLNLSVKKYEEWLEKERVSSFISSQGEPSLKLGDLLGDRLKSITEQD